LGFAVTVPQAEVAESGMKEQPRYPQSSRKFARAQRRNMTRAETMLWQALRNHRAIRVGRIPVKLAANSGAIW
jgi:hypothetical protein